MRDVLVPLLTLGGQEVLEDVRAQRRLQHRVAFELIDGLAQVRGQALDLEATAFAGTP